MVESFGLEIGTKRAPGIICAVSSLESIYHKYGIHVLSRVLRLIIGTWEGDINSFSANALNAVAISPRLYLNSGIRKAPTYTRQMLSRIEFLFP